MLVYSIVDCGVTIMYTMTCIHQQNHGWECLSNNQNMHQIHSQHLTVIALNEIPIFISKVGSYAVVNIVTVEIS